MPAEMTMLADHPARQLLDFSQKLDINLLDNVVNSMHHDIGSQVSNAAAAACQRGSDSYLSGAVGIMFFCLFLTCCCVPLKQRVAQEVLTNLKDHPDAWTRVDTILEFSQNMKTKVSLWLAPAQSLIAASEQCGLNVTTSVYLCRCGCNWLVVLCLDVDWDKIATRTKNIIAAMT